MAGTTQTKLAEAPDGSMLEEMRKQLNQVILDLETLRAAYVLHQHAALNAAPSTQATAASALLAARILTHSPTRTS